MTITVTRRITRALIVCGWCEVLLRVEEWDWMGEVECTSHSICDDCLEQYEEKGDGEWD